MFHICVLQWVEAMAEAVYVPYLCVAVGGSNGSIAGADMFTFHVCVCCSGWKQWQ